MKLLATIIILGILVLPRVALSYCHKMELVKQWPSRFRQITNRAIPFPMVNDPIPYMAIRLAKEHSKSVSIEWFGHATFQITSSKGTRILTDPHVRDYLPRPSLPQHIVTTSHNHTQHSNIWMAQGDPIILNGLDKTDDTWQAIHKTIRDISVYTVPSYHDKSQGLQRGNNAIFVFRVDNICIAHLGDLGHRLTPKQLKMLGKIDVLLVPIGGGRYTITAQEGRSVTQQVKPGIAIPMHYWQEGGEAPFIQGISRVTQVSGPLFKITKKDLPKPTEYVILSWN